MGLAVSHCVWVSVYVLSVMYIGADWSRSGEGGRKELKINKLIQASANAKVLIVHSCFSINTKVLA